MTSWTWVTKLSKPSVGIGVVDLGPEIVGDQRLVGGKAEVDQPAVRPAAPPRRRA